MNVMHAWSIAIVLNAALFLLSVAKCYYHVILKRRLMSRELLKGLNISTMCRQPL